MPWDHHQLVMVDGLLPPRRDIHLVEASKHEQPTLEKRRALAASGTEPPSHRILVSPLCLVTLTRLVIDCPVRHPTDIQLGGTSFTP